ncbi:MAG: primosomal protein N' [Gammaproteobacteria bacterium]|nr:primosomal protein N' [Gammaproteobacteria bacterium]
MSTRVVHIAVPSPLRRSFDYLPPQGGETAQLVPGCRVRVPFGRGQAVGVVLAVASQSRVAQTRLKRVLEVLDMEPLLPAELLSLLVWASAYYHHPIGEVVAAALPAALRQGRVPRRRAVADAPPAISLIAETPPILHPPQAEAVQAVADASGFQAFLLEGVTGSGKTEVYLRLIERVIAAGQQVLVLVPEIALTPQLMARFTQRFSVPVALLHSGLSEGERLHAWRAARSGQAAIVVGTRSAVFTPLAQLGLIVVDEEHDLSLKQQEGFRYHARDVAVMRAQRAAVPVLLGSATPSLESLCNVREGRYRHLLLPERAGRATAPRITVLDMRSTPAEGRVSRPLLVQMAATLQRSEQALVFLNRRGYAPTLICNACLWVATCERCDTRMVLSQRAQRLTCHHCGASRAADTLCPVCNGTTLYALGHGTERVEETLARYFPGTTVARMDRDTTRAKGALHALIEDVHAGRSQILVGTQMLAKGHHFPKVTLVGILDADQGLYGVDFRAPERMAQLIVQVMGRAGRGEASGQVVIQTHHPEHPLLQLLLARGYGAFAEAALAERAEASLPPYNALALLRAEAVDVRVPQAFLEAARAIAEEAAVAGVQLLGPVSAPMERRAGRTRAQLLLQATQRAPLHRLLERCLPGWEGLKLARRVRWSLDVDPMEMD